MKFHSLDEPRRHEQVAKSEMCNLRLLREILAFSDQGRFTERRPWDAIARQCGVHRATVYRTLAAAERLLGVVIRIDVEEERPRIASWGVIDPAWIVGVEGVAAA